MDLRILTSSRQWPEVYDLCHTFLHVEQVKKHMAMPESHVLFKEKTEKKRVILAWPCVFLLVQRAKTCNKI